MVTADCWPNATNTGYPVGTVLTAYSGPNPITVAGTTINAKEFTSCLSIKADNVTITNSYFHATATCNIESGFYDTGGNNLVVKDTTFDCQSAGSAGNVQGYLADSHSATLTRLNILRCTDEIFLGGNVGGTLVQDSYLHNLECYVTAADHHADTIQYFSGISNVTAVHNVIYGEADGPCPAGGTAGSSGWTTGSGNVNVTFDRNLVAGAGFTTRCDEASGGGNSNFIVTNNRYSRLYYSTVGFFGPQSGCSTQPNTHTGNIYYDTGLPVYAWWNPIHPFEQLFRTSTVYALANARMGR
jgi:hypothetical protein